MRSAICFTPVRSRAVAWTMSSAMTPLANICRVVACTASTSALRRKRSARFEVALLQAQRLAQVHRVDLLLRVLVEQRGPARPPSRMPTSTSTVPSRISDRVADRIGVFELCVRDPFEPLVDARASARAPTRSCRWKSSSVASAFCQIACTSGDSGANGSSSGGSDASRCMSSVREPIAIEMTTYDTRCLIASSTRYTRSPSGVAAWRSAARCRACVSRCIGSKPSSSR